MASSKLRLDELLVRRGLFPDTDQALRSCMAGEVKVGTQVVTLASTLVPEDAEVSLAPRKRFVSRGGEKLQGALEALGLDVTGLHCLDMGASTGGFTDCLLQAGAGDVVAVDVGYGQLAWSLQTDSRVTVLDRTNIRKVEPEEVGAPFDLVVADLSFIGLAKILPVAYRLLPDKGLFLALVKPQFEAGRSQVGEGGVVRDRQVHIQAVEKVVEAAGSADLPATALCASPLPGQEGNIEFFLLMQRGGEPGELDIPGVVDEAHGRSGGRE